MNNLEDILGRLEGVKSTGANYTAKCPCHDDSSNSLSIFKTYDGNYIPFCHAGCDYQSLKAELGINASNLRDKGITNIYQYYTKDGEESFQCLRYFPKNFKQRRKVGEDWVWDLKGVDLTLYRLPELLASQTERAVFIVEGEKDADRLRALDLVAVAYPLGAGKWRESYTEFLVDRTCYVITDNDKPGLDAGLKVAKALYGKAKLIKIINFGDTIGLKEDISDYLDKYSLEDLKFLIKNTKEFKPGVEAENLPVTAPQTQIQAAPELELTIIDSCLTDNSLFLKASEYLIDSDFYLPIHRKAFKIASALYDASNFVDKDLLLTRLRIDEDAANLKLFADRLNGNVISFYSFEVYCKTVKHKSKIRSLIKECDYIATKAREDTDGTVFDEAEEKIYGVNSDEINLDGDFESIETITNDIIVKGDAFAASGDHLLGLDTGYNDLNNLTMGLQRGDYVIVAARPSMGKTSLVCDIVNSTIMANKRVAIFTLEMTKEQIVAKMMSQNLAINANDIKRGNLSESQRMSVNQFKQMIAGSNVKINAKPGISPQQMRRSLRRLAAQIGDLDLIVVDYMQLMSGNSLKSENRQQEMTTISRELKGMAKIFDAPLIAVSQLSRKPEERKSTDYRPLMSDLRESGSLEQDADIIAFLYREDYYNKHSDNPGLTEIIVAKNRNGPVDTCYLQFIKEYTHFEASTVSTQTNF